MSFNIEVQGGKNYLLPTGGKYCPQDIAIAAIGGQTEGMYCWAKKEVVATYPEITGDGVTITQTGNVYNVTTDSSSGWANHKFMTPTISLGDGESVDIYHTVGATGHTYQMGFTASTPTAYSNHVIAFKVDGSTMYQVTGSTNVASYGTCAAGDVIHLELKDGTLSVYRNDALLFSTSVSLSICVFSAWFYGASKNGGSYEIKADKASTVGYVIGNEENAFPNKGFADDGYYYVKVGATKVTPKYASGSATHSSNTITVSGLGFRPYAVMIYYSTSCLACGICNSDGTVASAYGMKGSSSASATFAPSSDGFKFTYSNFSSYSVPFTWHAIGY